MGTDAQGTLGDEETGHAEHAGFDSRVEAKGPRQRLEEVAEWKGQIGPWTLECPRATFYPCSICELNLFHHTEDMSGLAERQNRRIDHEVSEGGILSRRSICELKLWASWTRRLKKKVANWVSSRRNLSHPEHSPPLHATGVWGCSTN